MIIWRINIEEGFGNEPWSIPVLRNWEMKSDSRELQEENQASVIFWDPDQDSMSSLSVYIGEYEV